MDNWLKALKKLNPCAEAWKWAQKFDDPQTLWNSCDNPSWMMWLVGRTTGNNKLIVELACQFARLALPYAKSPVTLACIETVEKWIVGEATIEQVRETRRAAAYAYAYAAYAAYAAAYAAKQKILAECCDIIREAVPRCPLS